MKNEIINTNVNILNTQQIYILEILYKYRTLSFLDILYKIGTKYEINDETQMQLETYSDVMYLIKFGLIDYDIVHLLYDDNYQTKNNNQYEVYIFTLSKNGLKKYKDYTDNVSVNMNREMINEFLNYTNYKTSETLLRHNYMLTLFVLKYEKYINSDIEYIDEKLFKGIYEEISVRPDGMIIDGDQIYLLEMDMATESKQVLEEKFKKYTNSLNDLKLYYKDKTISILFINNTVKREYVVKAATNKHLKLMTGLREVNFFTGIDDEILDSIIKFQKETLPPISAVQYNSENYTLINYNNNLRLLYLLNKNTNVGAVRRFIVIVPDNTMYYEFPNSKYIYYVKEKDFNQHNLNSNLYIKTDNIIRPSNLI